MTDKKYIYFGMVVMICMLIGIMFLLVTKPPERVIFHEITPETVEDYPLELSLDDYQDDALIAEVVGTIYSEDDVLTIFGSCKDGYNHPTTSTATVKIYNSTGQIEVDDTAMTIIDTGRFRYNTVMPTTDTIYFIIFNCTNSSGNWAVGLAEFQVQPAWIQKLYDIYNSLPPKQTLSIDIEVVSPIYPNEAFYVEAVFKNASGKVVTPNVINLTIYDPNEAVFDTASISDFTKGPDNVWKYTKSVGASPTTGRYTVHMEANWSGVRSIAEPEQIRVATGGPYKFTILADDGCIAQDLYIAYELIDEGEVDTEAHCTLFIDTDGDGEQDSGEPQTSFSRITQAWATVRGDAWITIPANYVDGYYTVYGECSYDFAAQPNATASDGTNIYHCGTGTYEVSLFGGMAAAGMVFCLYPMEIINETCVLKIRETVFIPQCAWLLWLIIIILLLIVLWKCGILEYIFEYIKAIFCFCSECGGIWFYMLIIVIIIYLMLKISKLFGS